MRGLILVSALHKFVTYLLTYNNNNNLICIAQEYQRLQRRWRTESAKTFTHLLTVPDPHGADATRDATLLMLTLITDGKIKCCRHRSLTGGGFLRRWKVRVSPNDSVAMVGWCPSAGSSSACQDTWSWPSRYRFASTELNVRPVLMWSLSISIFTTAGHSKTHVRCDSTTTLRRIPNISAVICTKQCPILILQQKC